MSRRISGPTREPTSRTSSTCTDLTSSMATSDHVLLIAARGRRRQPSGLDIATDARRHSAERLEPKHRGPPVARNPRFRDDDGPPADHEAWWSPGGPAQRAAVLRGRRPDSGQNAGRPDLGILRACEPAGQGSLVYSWGPARSPQVTAFTRTCLLSARRPAAWPERHGLAAGRRSAGAGSSSAGRPPGGAGCRLAGGLPGLAAQPSRRPGYAQSQALLAGLS